MPIENICSQLTTLASFYMQGIKELTSLLVGIVEKNHNLRSLIIGHFENLMHLPNGLLHKLPLLDELFISSCPNLELIPITEGVSCLRELNIKDCKKLSSLLSIQRCENLMHLRLVKAMQRLDKLQELVVDECTRLEERCAKKASLKWPKISHVPNVMAWGKGKYMSKDLLKVSH
ncbi:hypothetical protein L3X38_011151 [Prunus dulcis]|uniref:Uncharacterized protein n=1 Tax=Prunus dulcis TaxID=3755 RepID=A0AAD4WGZ5_PRUDU|nr:hypothetical protein L3X38_011151 [Prunus dulcis]